MDSVQLENQKQEVIQRYGDWTAHNFRLNDEIYTIHPVLNGNEIKLRRVVQCVADTIRKPLSQARILDLACLEGMYSVEFARQGAQAVGLEGRETNVAKARFAKEALGLSNLEFVQDDVRNLSVEKYGHFDAVLCLGILYHLEAPDIFEFLESLAAVCQGVALIDTHVSLVQERSTQYKGRTYWGKTHHEHDVNTSNEQRLKELWSSLDNPTSFWFTRAALFNVLAQVGFTSVYECAIPPEAGKPDDRVTLLAIKGTPQIMQSTPLINSHTWEEVPENAPYPQPAPARTDDRGLRQRLKRFLSKI